MSKLKTERLNKMIENAISYNQQSKRFNSDFLNNQLETDDKGYIITKADSTETSIRSFCMWGYSRHSL